MRLRKLAREEHVLTRPLYEKIFSEDSSSFVDYYYTEKTRDNEIFVIEEEERIVSMIHLNPYTLLVNGQEEPAHYIVAVATEKDFRKRGYMSALLKTSLREMYREGEPFTFLMPASEDIYRPHGFCTVYEQEQRFYSGGKTGNPSETVREAKAADAGRIADFASRTLEQRYQVYARRDAAYYERLIREYESDGGRLILKERDGEIRDCLFRVAETPVKKPRIMIRIVYLERLLMLLKLNYLMAACFHVTDPLIPENNKCLLLTGTEYSGVMLMEGDPKNSEGTLTIEALGRLVFGAGTADEISDEDDVKMTPRLREELKKIIPLSRIYLNEIV